MSRETKFTKGEWLADGTTVYFLDWDGQSYEGRGATYREQLTNRFCALFQGSAKRIPPDELEANAVLAAASPSMYAALEYARNLIGPDEIIDAALSRARSGGAQ